MTSLVLVGIHDTLARFLAGEGIQSVLLEIAPTGEGKGTIDDVEGLQDG